MPPPSEQSNGSMKKGCKALTGILACAIGSPSPAAEVENPWFVELGLSLSQIDSPLELGSNPSILGGIWIPSPGGPITVSPTSGFETDEGLTFTLGRKFANNWGVEISYLDFGDFGSQSSFTAGNTSYISQQTEVNIDGLNLTLFGEIPITDRWAVRGKVGVFAYDSDSGVLLPRSFIQGLNCDVVNDRDACYNPFFVTDGTPSNVFIPPRVVNGAYIIPGGLSESDGGQRVSFTVGGSYKITDRYSINLDYSLFNDVNETDVEMVKFGLSYRF